MTEDNKDGLSHLIEKELNSNDKILKPDFSQKTGRELLAFYLQTNFKNKNSNKFSFMKPSIFNVYIICY